MTVQLPHRTVSRAEDCAHPEADICVVKNAHRKAEYPRGPYCLACGRHLKKGWIQLPDDLLLMLRSARDAVVSGQRYTLS